MVTVESRGSSRNESAQLAQGLDLFEKAAFRGHAEFLFDGGG
jgi:hypothetical protein